jgi:diketogulonate reductase-like aldo/keto reductase
MGVSSADLVLLQWEEEVGAVGAKGAGLVDAAMWVSELQAAGLTKAVGVANLDVPTTLQAGSSTCRMGV